MDSFQSKIKLTIKPAFQSEGDGAKVMRLIGIPELKNFDPFLMLDLFSVKLPAGFPDHPHRGFATMTYLISGKICHEDFKGHKGELGPGDIQVMTAGKGIVHAEMPMSFDEPAYGFQLWINLAMKEKYCEPDYKEYKAENIVKVEKPGFNAKIIIGQYDGVKGLIQNRTPVDFVDLEITNNDIINYNINEKWNTFIVIHEGTLIINEQKYESINAIYFEQSDKVSTISIKKPDNIQLAKFIIVSGQPINEKIFQYGPFVLTSEYELAKTFEDYEDEKNGFEGRSNWNSKIKDLKVKK